MATQPTNLPVPSESPRDLKFNAGKIDEFATSMGWTYTDRFGQKHYTIEGINYLSQQAMAAYGYVILTGKTFTTGATINNPNEVLLNTADGEYYKWTGSFASGGKVVPANSTPSETGGIGPGAWLGVGDSSLRASLASDDDGNGDALVAVKQPYAGAVARTQHQKNAEFISVTDFGAVGDGADHPLSEKFTTLTAAQMVYPFVTSLSQTQDYAGFQAAIDTAGRSGGRGAAVYVPTTNGQYMVDGVNVNSAVTLYGDGKYGAKIKNRSGTCVTLLARFAAVKGLNFEGGGKDAGNTTAVRIREALVTVTGNSFAFFDACVMAEKGYASAELIIKGNRFAASNYAVFFGGGQINSHLSHNTYADNYTHIHVDEDLSLGLSGTTEGLVFSNELLYVGGKDSSGRRAIEVNGTRWMKWSTKTGHRVRVFPVSVFRFVWG